MPEAPKRVHIQARPTNRVSPRSLASQHDLVVDASGQTIHPQSRPRHHLAVLDVGYSGRDALGAHMLAITKIIRDRVRPLAAFGHFLEG
jgi:hypothetical protein